MEIGFIFPGQGSQQVSMGKDLYDKYEFVKEIFQTGNQVLRPVLRFDITDLIFNGSNKELSKTINCQPAMLLTNLAYFSVLNKKYNCNVVLGHSVGEYSALVAAKSLELKDAIRLVRKRAEFMTGCIPDEAVEEQTTHMAAVITSNQEKVYETCKRISYSGNIVQVANINSDKQVVISGNNKAVVKAVDELRNYSDIRISYLNVEGPFHSEIMLQATMEMKKVNNI